ncbi:MAG: hypothetical protein A2Z29_04975 [Chloroflexi bacterium RBG_16_56_11]|nr:MAG: hypothetical protein A2Z29_04975 [Chloroflexi bacterium RBG_16_56_11]
MMRKKFYIKDTEKFWRKREKARSALDRKRAGASLVEKVEIAEKLRADAAFLKGGKIITTKP